ncbi:MAG: hypothetical protein ACOC3V_04855, partial [bacterium]
YTERKTTDDFNRIASEIIPILEKDLETNLHLVKSYHGKETHGDMDILIKITHDFYNKGIDIRDYIKNRFNPNEIHNNGGVYSFDYDHFQIDIIPIKESNWECSKGFFNYDPTGNLMGKSAHKFGLKYGFEGLVYPFRNFNGRLSRNIKISTDNRKIFEFLGYDYDKFINGFDTLKEIFDYVIEGKYFDHSIFLMENLNSIDKKRNKKRKTYQQFLEYIEENNIYSNYNFKKNKSEYIEYINDYFPESNLIENIEKIKDKDTENKELHSKFNGKLIMSIYPELKGKELGDMITNFQKSYEDYRNFALNNTSEEIMEQFSSFYEKEKGN